jgi:site-specific recombinase XerD
MTTAETRLDEYFEARYRPRQLYRAARSTIRAFHVAFEQFAAFLGRRPVLSDLSDQVVAEFALWRIACGRSAATATRLAAAICALWRFAANEGLLNFWPAVVKVPTVAFTTPVLRVYSGE